MFKKDKNVKFEIIEASVFLKKLENNQVTISPYLNDKLFSFVLRGYIDSEKFNAENGYTSINRHYVYLCRSGNEILGVQYFNYSKWGKRSELFSIYVDKHHRGTGISKHLIESSIEFLINKNIKIIQVPLSKCNEITPPIYILKNHFEYLKSKYIDSVELQINLCK